MSTEGGAVYGYTNYDAVMGSHQLRMQRARASAVNAGLGQKERSHRSPLRFSARHLANRAGITITPTHSPETMLWA